MSILEQTKAKMRTAIEHFKNDLKNIRTGRANPGMVEHVMIEVYGSSMRLKDIASITTPEARVLQITPFDPQITATISKGIEKANLGFNPNIDGNIIRLKIPPMTEELRKKMAKICHDEKEKSKVIVRNLRREANELARHQKAEGEIGEDLLKKLEKQIQDETDKACKEIDELADKKEKEVAVI